MSDRANNIFTRGGNNTGGSPFTRFKSIEDFNTDTEANEELNSYKKYYAVNVEVPPLDATNNGKEWTENDPGEPVPTVMSLFSKSHGVGAENEYQLKGNAPLIDSPATREIIRQHSDCSVKSLVNLSKEGKMGRAIYEYSDFMFCKHLGRISNNYLITLRRFPMPAGDHINFIRELEDPNEPERNQHIPDIGRMVTWMGTPGNDMSNILKYKVNLPWKEWKAEIQEREGTDSGGGTMGGLLQLASAANNQRVISGGSSTSLAVTRSMLKPFGIPAGDTSSRAYDGWAYHRDTNKAYGPVDAIAKTYIRAGAEDGGITFDHSIQLQFDYEMRAYDGINTKAAFLDLLANVLMVTYTDATYWGGAVRGTGAAQSNIFANLPIYNLKAPLGFAQVSDALLGSIKDITSVFNNGKPFSGIGDIFNMVKNLGKGLMSNAVGGFLNALGRPQRNALNALVNFAPTGVWHLTIGNPRHPIMVMGNMKMDDCTIEHIGPLGLDDFPTGLRVNITLSHAQPRDNLKIEQMYQSGDNRIYTPFGAKGLERYQDAVRIDIPKSEYMETLPDKVESKQNEDLSKVTPTIEYRHVTDLMKRTFVSKFGTDNAEAISITIKDAHLGSQRKIVKSKDKGSTGNNKNK